MNVFRSVSVIATGVLLASGCGGSSNGPAAVTIDELDRAPSIVSGNVRTSRFETGAEGWLIDGNSDFGSRAPDWFAATGTSSGQIGSSDSRDDGIWYYEAPAAFKDNLIEFYGGALAFDLNASEPSASIVEPDIILDGGGDFISYRLPRPPSSSFRRFEIPLSESGWVDSDALPVDVNRFTEVLMTIDRLRIRGEYRAGDDAGRLDNVSLTLPGT